MESLAPVVLFVYARPEHTQRTLEALCNNELADQSDLFIFADGPKVDADHEQLNNISEVREIIRANKWCGNVRIYESNDNLGLGQSVINGVSKVLKEYDSAIVLEDDIAVNRGFLKYMNSALALYRNDKEVAGVSGYCYPNFGDLDQTYFLPISSSWGWATWKEFWDVCIWDSDVLINKIENNELSAHFNFGNYPFLNLLRLQQKGDIDSWAIRFYASVFLNQRLFLYPRQSLLINIGFDDTGTHSKESDQYYNKYKSTDDLGEISKIPVLLNDKQVDSVRKAFDKRHGHQSRTRKIMDKLKSIFND